MSPLSIVALHGVADSAEQIDQLTALVPSRVLTESPDVRWVFPRASQRAISILGGQIAHAWYDILAFDRSRLDDLGIAEARDIVVDVVRAEREEGRRVVLVGFSQGGSLALSVAAIFLLYRYLPNHEVGSRQVLPAAIAAGVVAEGVRWVYLRVLPLLDLPKSQGPYYVSVSFALLAYFEAFVLMGGAYMAARPPTHGEKASAEV